MYPEYFWTPLFKWHAVMSSRAHKGAGKCKASVTAKEPTSCSHLLPFTSREKKLTEKEKAKSSADWNIFQKKLIEVNRDLPRRQISHTWHRKFLLQPSASLSKQLSENKKTHTASSRNRVQCNLGKPNTLITINWLDLSVFHFFSPEFSFINFGSRVRECFPASLHSLLRSTMLPFFLDEVFYSCNWILMLLQSYFRDDISFYMKSCFYFNDYCCCRTITTPSRSHFINTN